MKLNVVVDMKGNVVGTYREEVQSKGGLKIRAGMVMQPGYLVHQIEVDDKILKQPALKIHETVQKLLPRK
jgi:hypothetical protein